MVLGGWSLGASGALRIVTLPHDLRLKEQGPMQSAGLAQVEAAHSDGRWATGYASSATMVIPEDFWQRCDETLRPKLSSPRSNASASSLSTTGCTAPRAPKPGRSAWQNCWQSWRVAKALEIFRQREGMLALVLGPKLAWARCFICVRGYQKRSGYVIGVQSSTRKPLISATFARAS